MVRLSEGKHMNLIVMCALVVSFTLPAVAFKAMNDAAYKKFKVEMSDTGKLQKILHRYNPVEPVVSVVQRVADLKSLADFFVQWPHWYSRYDQSLPILLQRVTGEDLCYDQLENATNLVDVLRKIAAEQEQKLKDDN
jgi:hypothetical protein